MTALTEESVSMPSAVARDATQARRVCRELLFQALCERLNNAAALVAVRQSHAAFVELTLVLQQVSDLDAGPWGAVLGRDDSFSVDHQNSDHIVVVPLHVQKDENLDDFLRNPLGGSDNFFPLPFCLVSARLAWPEQLRTIRAIVGYNIGLTYHTEALRLPKEQYEQRKRLAYVACDFYLRAYGLLDEMEDLSPSDHLFQVFLALCNNLAELERDDRATHDTDTTSKAEENEWQTVFIESFVTVPPEQTSVTYRHFETTSLMYSLGTTATPAA
jgi:hypothetical protein